MELLARFIELTDWLQRHQALWRARPFTTPVLEWEADCPALAKWLRQRSLADAEAAQLQPALLQGAPEPFARLAAEAAALCELPRWSNTFSESVPELLHRHIPGRKWQQITRFAAVTAAHLPAAPQRWVDWCAGKGHLGRLLAWQSGCPVCCLERDAELNHAGAVLSERLALSAEHLDTDVMQASCAEQLQPDDTLVALHACGDLHRQLIEQVVARDCRQLALSPCCYNRIAGTTHQPLSRAGRAAGLVLSRDELGLALQQTATAGARELRQRDRSMAWRLAFDYWQRQERGVDNYLPTPSRAPGPQPQSLEDFCRAMAGYHNLDLPAPADWQALEAHGWQRLAEVRNLELVGALFRRPLELWLVLERALYLQEAGYRVQLGEFCAPTLTPRNLLLLAQRDN
ncbi:MAG: methyltransferase [Pseudomonadaceae bacterium]